MPILDGMTLSRPLPALLGALILFALVLAAAAEARPMTGTPGPDRLTVPSAVAGATVIAGGGPDRVRAAPGPDRLFGERAAT